MANTFSLKNSIKRAREYALKSFDSSKEYSEEYRVVLEMAGNKYQGRGNTIDEALSSLGLSWEQIKAKGVVEITRGGKTYEHLFYLGQLRRIFANKLTRMMWGKRLELLFEGKGK